MDEEIKEIVKDNNELLVLYKDNSFRTFDTLTVDVTDYIINLQQGNKRLKTNWTELKKCIDEVREYITTNTCWELKTSKVLEILDKVTDK